MERRTLRSLWWFWLILGVAWLSAAAPVLALSCVASALQYVIVCEQGVCQPAYKITWEYQQEGCRTVPYVQDVTAEDEKVVRLIREGTEFRGREGVYLLYTDNEFFYDLSQDDKAEPATYRATIGERSGQRTVEEWRTYDVRQSWLERTGYAIGFWVPILLVFLIFGLGLNHWLLRPQIRAYKPVWPVWIGVTLLRILVAAICFGFAASTGGGLARYFLAAIVLVLFMMVELPVLFGSVLWHKSKWVMADKS